MNKYTAEDFANARFAEHPETNSLIRFMDAAGVTAPEEK